MKHKNNVCKFVMFMLLICLTKFQCASSQCNDDQWECDNGECIDGDDKCNGKVDCKDGSDEIPENCIQQYKTCPHYSFNCRYGACIAGSLRCNNRQDCSDNSDELICTNIDDAIFQGRCAEDEMQCLESKECISSYNVCNGPKDCKDGSDETVQLCVHYGCHKKGFPCGYGGCIVEDYMCNGINDCADGSDEAWELCNYTRKANRGSTLTTVLPTRPTPPTSSSQYQRCKIPNADRLVFKLHPDNETIQLGSFVDDSEAVHIECNNGVTLRGDLTLICQNGNLIGDLPSCLPYCDGSLVQGLSTRAICDPDFQSKRCGKKILPNTVVQINCNTGYKSDHTPQRIRCLPDGTFDKQRLPCEINCGRIVTSAEGLSKGGIPTKPSKAPWHVAIYEYSGAEYIYFCSGSIVSPRVVISAAHCFWDISNSVKKRSMFQVKAGKISNNFTSSANENPQTVDVAEIFIPNGYEGVVKRFRLDIALIILKTPLEYNENISGICIPDNFQMNSLNYVVSDLTGFISGFGLYNQLEKLRMLTISYHACHAKDPIADDKFCIYNKDGASVCRGESGGGFVTKSVDTWNDDVYKLLGVISNTPSTKNDCTREETDAQVAITGISYIPPDFEQFLRKALNEDKATF